MNAYLVMFAQTTVVDINVARTVCEENIAKAQAALKDAGFHSEARFGRPTTLGAVGARLSAKAARHLRSLPFVDEVVKD
jgi:hypothetical protein